jgi:glycosyltransferase involved in cell wall biosynthesis
MKILYVVKQLSEGGIDTLLDVYIQFFAKNNSNKVILVSCYPINKNKSIYEKISSYNVEIFEPNKYQEKIIYLLSFFLSLIYLPIKKLRNRKYTFKNSINAIKNILYVTLFPLSVFSITKTEKVDIIHLFGIILDSTIFRFLVLKNNKVIFSEVEDPSNRNSNKRKFSKFLNSCSKIIVPSSIIENKINAICPNIKEKISIIPWTIHEIGTASKSKNYSNKKLVFGSSGRLHNLKGFHILLEALSKIKNKNWKLIIAGDGEEYINLVKQSQILNIDNNIIFLGWTKDIISFFSQVDIFIHPSFSEGMPMVVIEALYFSKPVIATNVGSVKEMLDENCGFIIEINNSNVLAEKINYFIDNPETIEKMSIHSRKIFEEKFSQNTILSKIECTYELLKSKKNGTKENI